MKQQLTTLLQKLRPATRSLGIEITDSSIKAVEMTIERNGQIIVHGCETEALPNLAVDDGRIKEMYSVIRSMQALIARLNPKTKQVHMVAPSQSVMIRFLKLPDLPMKEMKKLIDFEVKHNIHLPFDQPVYDFMKLNEADPTVRTKQKKAAKVKAQLENSNPGAAYDWMSEAAAAKEDSFGIGNKADPLFGQTFEDEASEADKLRCDVMLVAAPLDLVQEYTEVAKAAGLKLQSLEIKALSLFRLIHETGTADSQATFLVLDVNSKASDVSIFNEGLLKITRSLPNLVEDMPTRLELDASTGLDALFAEFTQNESPAKTVANDLTHELERLMNFYRYTLNNRNQVFDRLLLSGDVPYLSELAVLLEEKLSLQVVQLYADRISKLDQHKKLALPAYAVPVGLALRGEK